MSTLTTTRIAELPRVNLLPPEIEEQRRLRVVKGGLAAAVAASLVVAGGMFFWASSQASHAQDNLDAAQAQTAQLQAKQAQYSEVPKVFARVEAARAQLGLAMGKEIRWS